MHLQNQTKKHNRMGFFTYQRKQKVIRTGCYLWYCAKAIVCFELNGLLLDRWWISRKKTEILYEQLFLLICYFVVCTLHGVNIIMIIKQTKSSYFILSICFTMCNTKIWRGKKWWFAIIHSRFVKCVTLWEVLWICCFPRLLYIEIITY